MRRLILASTSKYRRELLSRLGLPFEAVAPEFDEDAAKPALRSLAPEALVAYLARKKAESLAERFPDALIVGSDQAVDL
ncbi:MAG TPA: Maf family protein, partial [Planctomycetota bacterium]|nr:Maf family protein [Planctomycetota bacterium]